MLLDSVRILDFDGSLLKQKNLIDRFHPTVVDLRGIGPACRNWAHKKTAARIKTLFAPGLKNAITFLGSGDFHHISSLLLEQFSQPLSVIVFDHHPDWDILPPALGCGSWIARSLKTDTVKKVLLLGPSSDDLDGGPLHTADLDSLKNNRVEIYPYAHKPSGPVFRRMASTMSVEVKSHLFSSVIYWQELKDKKLGDFFLSLLERLPTKQVYVSIDKDCLKAEHSLTNWEEGLLGLEQLLLMLSLIKKHLDIVGLDIVGEYSPQDAKGRFKAWCAALDHPRNCSARSKPEDMINTINEKTNIRLLEFLGS